MWLYNVSNVCSVSLDLLSTLSAAHKMIKSEMGKSIKLRNLFLSQYTTHKTFFSATAISLDSDQSTAKANFTNLSDVYPRDMRKKKDEL